MRRRKGKSHNSVGTPDVVYKFLERFHVKKEELFDPCPLNDNPTVDGLAINWVGPSVYCNPPYSCVKLWVKKCILEFENPSIEEIFLLVKCENLANSYMKDVHKVANLYTFSKRLTFVGYKKSAGFGSVLIHFNRKKTGSWETI